MIDLIKLKDTFGFEGLQYKIVHINNNKSIIAKSTSKVFKKTISLEIYSGDADAMILQDYNKFLYIS